MAMKPQSCDWYCLKEWKPRQNALVFSHKHSDLSFVMLSSLIISKHQPLVSNEESAHWCHRHFISFSLCVCAHMHACTWWSWTNSRGLPLPVSIFFIESGLSLTLELTSRLGWLARKPQKSSCLCPPPALGLEVLAVGWGVSSDFHRFD